MFLQFFEGGILGNRLTEALKPYIDTTSLCMHTCSHICVFIVLLGPFSVFWGFLRVCLSKGPETFHTRPPHEATHFGVWSRRACPMGLFFTATASRIVTCAPRKRSQLLDDGKKTYLIIMLLIHCYYNLKTQVLTKLGKKTGF